VIVFLVRLLGAGHRRRVAILLSAALGCMLAGAALFSITQRISFGKAVYWAITTATTVGYGDVTPHSGAGEIIAAAVMLTTIPLLASVFALLTGAAAVAGVRRILAMRDHAAEEGHRLILGMDGSVPSIIDELVRVGERVVLVADVEPTAVRPEVHVIKGDPTQPHVIESAHPERARQALITSAADADVLISAVLLRKIAPDLQIVALVSSAPVSEALKALGVWRTISPAEMIAHTLAKSLEAPHAADMLTQLVESEEHSLAERPADASAVGRPLSAIRDERSDLVLGMIHDGMFSLGIGSDPIIAQGDSLLIAEPRSAVARPG
jgi:voltage-gated potassium channel